MHLPLAQCARPVIQCAEGRRISKEGRRGRQRDAQREVRAGTGSCVGSRGGCTRRQAGPWCCAATWSGRWWLHPPRSRSASAPPMMVTALGSPRSSRSSRTTTAARASDSSAAGSAPATSPWTSEGTSVTCNWLDRPGARRAACLVDQPPDPRRARGPARERVHPGYAPGPRIMAAAMAEIASRGEALGSRWALTVVMEDDLPSIKGCLKAGFEPYMLKLDGWRLFHHQIRYTELPRATRSPASEPDPPTVPAGSVRASLDSFDQPDLERGRASRRRRRP